MTERIRIRLSVAVVASLLLLLPQIDELVTAPYDSWTHLLFASHYLHGWFAPVDSRWYLGFPVVGYPPLSHQAIAAVSLPLLQFGWDQTDALTVAYSALTVLLTALYPLAVYCYSTALVSRRAASYAALVGSVFTGWWMLLLGYGQFTTLTAAVITLCGGWAVHRALGTGGLRQRLLAVLLTALVPMTHHFTSISFLVGAYSTVVLAHVTRSQSSAFTRSTWPQQLANTLRRVAPVAVGSVLIASVAVFPFVQFLVTGPSQPVIPHGSRQSWLAGALFSRPQPYLTLCTGTLFLAAVPCAGYVAYRRGETPALVATLVAAVFGVLSLGFTTPLPRLLYPGLAETLTYFRFGAWGGFLLLPGVGLLVSAVCDGEFTLFFDGGLPSRRGLLLGFLVVLVASQVVISSQTTNLGAASPDRRAAADEIGEFMREDEHWKWRYLTLGMSQELGLVAIEAPHAQTVDGNYNAGRLQSNVPVLARSSAAQLSSAKFSADGQRVLDHYLANNHEHGIKFVFSADPSYASTLREHGFEVIYQWDHLDARAWYDPDTPPAFESRQSPVRDGRWLTASWGTVPLLTLLTSLFVAVSPVFGRSLASGDGEARAQ